MGLKKMEEKNSSQASLSSSQQEENSSSNSGKSRRGKGGRGNPPIPSSNIVCTSCHRDDINLVKQLVKMYGTYSFSTSVSSNTSHVVSGEGKRTLNLLKGLLQGCWIVTKEWVLSSLEESRWVDEEPYEWSTSALPSGMLGRRRVRFWELLNQNFSKMSVPCTSAAAAEHPKRSFSNWYQVAGEPWRM